MMQRFKAVSLLRHNHHNTCFLNPFRTLGSIPDSALTDDLDNQVLVESKAWSRTAILNRPPVLNALNTAMAARLQKLYTCWENDPDIGFVAMKGSGRSFCAGGDIVSLYHLINAGKIEDCKEFCRTLYAFIYFLGTYLKPHVALLNGITMGGGAAVSIPGTFRVATEKTEIEASKTNDPWCTSTLNRFKETSPLSSKVSLKSGVRARMVEKDFSRRFQLLILYFPFGQVGLQYCLKFVENPLKFSSMNTASRCRRRKYPGRGWDPPSLEQVSEDMVEHYFSPLNQFEPDLELPTKLREVFT